MQYVQDVTIKDQLKKFALKSIIGFQTVLVYGLGSRLGIFDYLYEKKRSNGTQDVNSQVIFSMEELSEKIMLDKRHLNAWLHMGIECGLFEINDPNNRSLITAKHVYDILIDKQNTFYIGGTLDCFYISARFLDRFSGYFRSGEIMSYSDIIPEEYKIAQSICSIASQRIEEIFAKHCKAIRRQLRAGGKILEVGCGYGYNLEIWARKYRKALITGIDIDQNGAEYTRDLVYKNGWQNRIRIIHGSLGDLVDDEKDEYDLILMNHVLHEMDSNEEYRLQTFELIHSLLKNEGLLLIVEHMIPDMFAQTDRFVFFEVWHRLLETFVDSRFYDEKEFRDFILSTSFQKAELIRENNEYCWFITK